MEYIDNDDVILLSTRCTKGATPKSNSHTKNLQVKEVSRYLNKIRDPTTTFKNRKQRQYYELLTTITSEILPFIKADQ